MNKFDKYESLIVLIALFGAIGGGVLSSQFAYIDYNTVKLLQIYSDKNNSTFVKSRSDRKTIISLEELLLPGNNANKEEHEIKFLKSDSYNTKKKYKLRTDFQSKNIVKPYENFKKRVENEKQKGNPTESVVKDKLPKTEGVEVPGAPIRVRIEK